MPGTPQNPPPIPGLGLCDLPESDAQVPPVDKPVDTDAGASSLRQVMSATEATPTEEPQNKDVAPDSVVEENPAGSDNATNGIAAPAQPEAKDSEMEDGPAPDGTDSAEAALLLAQSAIVDGETALPEVLVTKTQPEENGGPEWEADSSPYESSSSSDSSSSSSDDEDDDYQLLGPEEQARLLMEVVSDDEGGKDGKKDVRTANEKDEDAPPIPDIAVTADTKVEMLGNIEAVVDNIALVKANISGEYQVLETGSVLCLADLKLIGVVAETLGKVEQPLYTVRFKSAGHIKELGIEKGVPVFYVVEHSTFVFTQPLKGLKGSDASNFYDEEVGDNEVEFSDDEAEADNKRRQKQKRLERKEGDRPDRGNRRGRGRGAPRPSGLRNSELNYDDAPVEDGYTPLARPTNYHEMMGSQEAPLEEIRTNPEKPFRGGRGRGRDRGHDRGGRGRGRGGYQRHTQEQRDPTGYAPSPSNQNQNQPYQQAGYQQPGAPYGNQAPQPYNYFQPPQMPPMPPQMPPQMPQGNGFPSPMPMQFPPQSFPFILPYQQQQAFQFPPPGSHINPAFFANMQAQGQQAPQQPQQPQQQFQPPPASQPPQSNNQGPSDTFAAAQAQLELLRRLSQGNDGA